MSLTQNRGDAARKLQHMLSGFDIYIVQYHSSRTRRAHCCSTRLASLLLRFSLYLPFLSSVYCTLYYALSDMPSHIHLHAYVVLILSYNLELSSVECFILIAHGFGNRSFD